jgi:hypothetical protein
MANASHIHVRPLEIGDFGFIQKLASKQPNFTVPPSYVLWMMLRAKGTICLVAENAKMGPLAYLLAMTIENPNKALFVWQLAASASRMREKAILALLAKFRNITVKLGCSSIAFSSVPKSSRYRAIRRYAWTVFSSVPRLVGSLPSAINPNESEFLLTVKRTP